MSQATKLVRPLRNGQITIPSEFRKQLQIDEHTMLRIALVGDELRIRPVRLRETRAGSDWARELYDLFSPVRKEASKESEVQVNAAIDKVVAAVRRKHAKSRA